MKQRGALTIVYERMGTEAIARNRKGPLRFHQRFLP